MQPCRLPRRLLRHRAEEVVEGGVRAEAIERHLDLEREVAPPRVVEAAHALPPRQRRQRTAHPLDEAARGLSSVAQEGPEHLDDEQAPVGVVGRAANRRRQEGEVARRRVDLLLLPVGRDAAQVVGGVLARRRRSAGRRRRDVQAVGVVKANRVRAARLHLEERLVVPEGPQQRPERVALLATLARRIDLARAVARLHLAVPAEQPEARVDRLGVVAVDRLVVEARHRDERGEEGAKAAEDGAARDRVEAVDLIVGEDSGR